jgi:hypothetical protein
MPETAAKPQKRATAAPKPKTKAKGAAAQENVSKAPKKTGKYTPELITEIFRRISLGESLLQICRDEGMPTRQAVYDWVHGDETLALQFARAREEGCDAMAEEALHISNTPHIGKKKVYSSGAEDDEDSMTVTEEDMLGHRKLQIETRLKLLACWNPKKYGTKVQMGGDPGNPIKIEAQVEADNFLAAIMKNAELKRQVSANE